MLYNYFIATDWGLQIKNFIAILFLLISSIAQADDLDIIVHGASWHSSGNFNERNEGLGIVYNKTPELSLAGGFYDNSLGKQSAYLFMQYKRIVYKDVYAGAFGGFVSGYPLTKVAAGLMLQIDMKTYYHDFKMVPKIKGITPAVVSYSVGLKF